jgi:hypothetical protein
MEHDTRPEEAPGLYDHTLPRPVAALVHPVPTRGGPVRSIRRGPRVRSNLTGLAAGHAAEELSASAADLVIYTDTPGAGWANWSWDTTVSFNNAVPVYSGTASVSVTFDAAWGGFYLHTDNTVDSASYTHVSFCLHGGSTGNQQVQFCTYDSNNKMSTAVPLTLQANAWNQVDISLSALGNLATISGMVWQDTSGNAQPVFYIDQIRLTRTDTVPKHTLKVAAAGHHPISPNIYGMNHADEAFAAELHLPVRRFGWQ